MKNLSSLFFITAALCCTSSTFAITYNDYIEDVLSHSKSLKITKEDLNAEKERLKPIDRYYIPTLSSSSEYRVSGDDDSESNNQINLSVVLYEDKNSYLKQQKEIDISSLEITIKEDISSIKKTINSNLIGIYHNQELKMLAKKLMESSNDLYLRIKNQYDNGAVSTKDLKQAELLVNKVNSEIKSINKDIALFKSNIEIFTGLAYPEDEVELIEEEINKWLEYDIDSLDYESNYAYMNLINEANKSLAQSKAQSEFIKVKLNSYYRSYDEGGGEGLEDDYYVGFEASMNLFDYNKNQEKLALVSSYSSNKLRASFKLEEVQNNIKSEKILINSIYDEIDGVEQEIKVTEDLVETYRIEYDTGKVSLYEALNTRFDLFLAKKKHSELLITLFQSKVSALDLAGKL